MIRFKILFIAFLFTHQVFSQTSPLAPVCTFNYQAVARSADDNVIANQAVTIQFTILDGPGANELYIEEHDATTSSLGLINLEVGAGTRTGGSMVFEAIPWIIRKHFLKVDMDMDGSGNFINLGEAPILAVPIAISAKVAGSAIITMDTIKRIDTLRVDTLTVKKIFADVICVDSIKGKVVIDSIITESICANGDVIIKNGALILKDETGKILFQVDTFGDSYHYGFETFDGGLEVRDKLGNPIFQTPIPDLFDIFQFWAATEINGNVKIADGGLEMVNAQGEIVFSVDKNGNSYHKGFETFEGGLEITGEDGAPLFTIDPAVFGSNVFIDGNTIIQDGSLDMVDAQGEVIFSVDKDGNSFHKGLEEFAGGILLTNPANNETVIYLDAEADGLTGYAMIVNGNFMLNGLFQAEAKNFLIDHPLNPEEMTLRHYSVESDQMGTVYNGTVEFDDNGEAIVELPRWFEALNTDFSYQLTCIGGFSNVYVAEEVSNNQFKIGGGKDGMKVSWQVNGVRHDPVSSKHIKPIEEYKSVEEKQ